MKRQCFLIARFCNASTLQLFIASTLSLASFAFAEPVPSAKEILDSVRMLESRQQIDLQGQLRENEIVIPFRLTQTGPIIRYALSNPDQVLRLRLGENNSRLDVVTGAENFAASQLNQKIRGTGITYEDLALKFLYWPNAKL